MDILNFISWIRGGRKVSTVDTAKTLIPLGVKDSKRDDSYLAATITVQDLADQIVPPPTPPTPINPTSGFYPINDNGVLQDGGLTNAVTTPPMGFSYLGLKFIDTFNFGQTLLELNPFDLAYTFGNASYDAPISQVSASGGLSVLEAGGEAIIGCGISSPTNGVFRASGVLATVSIGTNPSTSLGVFASGNPAVVVGSSFNDGVPTNTSTPVAWTRVRTEAGTTYYLPLYQ